MFTLRHAELLGILEAWLLSHRMGVSVNDLVLKAAKLVEHDDILNITAGEQLYDGYDLLPCALEAWLREGEDLTSNRHNFVFCPEESIVGFRSIYFQDGGRACVRFAFRISKFLRGKGFGRHATTLLEEYLRENFPDLEKVLSAKSDANLCDEEIKSSKHGELLFVKSVINYKFSMPFITIPETAEDGFRFIPREEFSQILGSEEKTGNILQHNIAHVHWVPVILGTEADIEFATRQKQDVLLHGSVDAPISFSILTLQNASKRTCIDIFAGDENDIKNHVKLQIGRLSSISKGEAGEFLLSLVMRKDMEAPALEMMEDLGWQRFQYKYGSQDRQIPHMYIHSKQA